MGTKAAAAHQPQATMDFEVLSRQVPGFPTRVSVDGTYYVDHWGDHLSAEAWFYFYCGTDADYDDEMVLFAELLDCFLQKFLVRIRRMGFLSCEREEGTWNVTAVWDRPKEESPPCKKARQTSA